MACPDVVVLSSSPPDSLITTTPHKSGTLMSSSPCLPSPSKLVAKGRPITAHGSRAGIASEGVTNGFATASSLLRDAYDLAEAMPLARCAYNDRDLSMQQPRVSSGAMEAEIPTVFYDATASTTNIGVRTKRSAGAKVRFRNESKRSQLLEGGKALVTNDSSDKKAKEFKMPKAPKNRKEPKEQGQTRIRKGKVTKISAGNEAVQKIRRKTVGGSDTPTALDCVANLVVDDQANGSNTAENLDSAKHPDGSGGGQPAVFFETKNRPLTSRFVPEDDSVVGFGSFVRGYKLEDTSEDTVGITREQGGKAIVKRRRIEVTTTPEPLRLPSKPAKKPKASKKKAPTITEKATAQYKPLDVPTGPSILDTFVTSPETNGCNPETAGTPTDKHIGDAQYQKQAAKSAKKGRKGVSTRKKQAPPLVPPAEAMMATSHQDLLFGTSSQLAQEESPAFLRDLVETIKVSESAEASVPNYITASMGSITKSGSSADSNLAQVQAFRNLWSEAARDAEGSLLGAEIIDLTDTPQARRVEMDATALTPPLKAIEMVEMVDHQLIGKTPAHSNNLVECPPTPIVAALPEAEPRDTSIAIPKSVAEGALRDRRKSRSPAKRRVSPDAQEGHEDRMPQFAGYAEAELSKLVASYGFKPIKNRGSMISLLERCWEGKNRLALQTLPSNVNTPNLPKPGSTTCLEAHKAPSPTKRRGRPPKAKHGAPAAQLASPQDLPPTKAKGRPRKLTRTHDPVAKIPSLTSSKPITSTRPERKQTTGDDIEDTNNPSTPSPPRRRSPATKSLLLSTPCFLLNAKNPSLVSGTKVLSAPPAQTCIFAKITEAITTFPPSHDTKHMTWNEKILMYDPIVLEDLTAWLNTVGLGRVGVDEEIGPGVVRAWCEEKSICCLWKENLRGGARSRY